MLKPSKENFPITLANECARAFSNSTGIGCTVSLYNGEIVYECGYGFASCEMCKLANLPKSACIKSHIYGMTEAERFGGKYIYFCPMGFTCFVSPLVGDEGTDAKITVGPFLMVERQDYVDIDLIDCLKLKQPYLNNVIQNLDNIASISADHVNDLSILLFMAVSFINNVNEVNKMIDMQESNAIQSKVSSYISQLKGYGAPPPYPFDTEKKLLECISHSDRSGTQKYLNELFGYILFSTGNDFSIAKSRVYELLVLISRTAINSGADPEKSLLLTHDYLQIIPHIETMEELCNWLTKVTNKFMDSLFSYIDVKHANIIHKSIQYIYSHYAEKITLESVSQMVYLSPAYFSRIFKQETGTTFNSFLNNIRIEKSKELLKSKQMKLVDIAFMVGFEDQSYFTKVFKKVTGITPMQCKQKKN